MQWRIREGFIYLIVILCTAALLCLCENVGISFTA